MVSNYEEITKDNLRRYGTDIDRYGPVFLTSLYSDRTHFIYELLQNAEDARATKIKFNLFNDRIEVSHDGKPFTEKNVEGICGLVESTKKGDLTQIGKFGIGFKSVYAYTNSPEIYSGNEHFCIEHYVRPRVIRPKTTPIEITTLFILKFNRQDISKADAYHEIGSHLRQFNPRNLLFLRHIEEIVWHSENGQNAVYKREIEQNEGGYRRVIVTVNGSLGSSQENWLVFEKQVPSKPDLKVEMAFRLQKDKKTNKEQIVPVKNSHLIVFFPTEKETHLNFLVQGPYRTTPDRAKIPPNDTFNRELIKTTAELVAKALTNLRDLGLLTVSCLQILPISASDFSEDTMFYSVFDRVCETLKEEELLPTPDGHYIPAIQAKLARSAALRKLLSNAQLQQLYGGNYTWLSDEISDHTTPELHRYLRDILKVEEIDPEKFASKFSQSFIERQSDEWVAEFYAFLKNQEALWKVETFRKNPPLLNKPFIRLENGKHVIPFDNTNRPNAYLPTDVTTSFPIIKNKILENSDAKAFLERLGLPKPSTYTEVRDRIIPKYQLGRLHLINYEQNKQDIQTIKHALNLSTSTERKQLIEKLQKTPFLWAVNAKTEQKEYQPPEKIYFRSQNLEVYFEGNETVWFLDNIAIDQDILVELGVSHTVRLYYTDPNSERYVILSEDKGNHKRGIKGFDPNFSIDGLAHALENPTEQKSVYIWNYLFLPNIQRLNGVIESSSYKTYQNAKRERKFSKAGQLACDKAWLPNLSGKFYQPRTLSIDDLSEDFIRDEKDESLAICIGVKPRADLVEEAKKIGILPELLDYLRRNRHKQRLLVEKLIKGEPSEGVGKNGTGQAMTSSNGSSPEPELPRIDYKTALKEAFLQPGKTQLNEALEPSPVANPEARLQKTRDSIRNDKKNEPPPIERFKKIESKAWEGKNKEIVTFLKEIYNGKCQICSKTFPKRNGEPYFERVYLVSYTKARWIDRPGNVLCLCPTCCAKFKHGSVEPGDDIEEQINSLPLTGGKLHIQLCGQDTSITFFERHIIALKGLLKEAVNSENQ